MKKFKRERKEPNTLMGKILFEGLDILKIFVLTYLVLTLFFHFIARPVIVQGDSMYPTLTDQDLGIADILFMNITGIQRNDIVIIYLEEKNEYLVKRVIALPNEKVQCKSGILYVNDEAVEENYLDPDYFQTQTEVYGQFTSDFGPVYLAEDEYWCLGDNRPISSDSRRYGPFKKEDITSRLNFIFYPFDHFNKY